MAEALLKNPESLPTLAGVYLFKDGSGDVLYVGKSTNLRERIKSHLFAKGGKTRALVASSKKIEYILVNYELEALLLEAALIKKYLPRYNTQAKDDKHPLYIKITAKEKFPKISTSRLEGEKNAIYFGPFPSSNITRQVLQDLRKIFPYCAQKSIGKKPCFYSHIGLCNPCPAAIVKAKNEAVMKKLTVLYRANINKTAMVLSGKTDSLIRKLEKEMKTAVKKEDFEKAVEKRNKLKALSYITTSYKPPGVYLEQPDFIEDLRRTELGLLQKLLAPFFQGFKYPMRIEYIDISHLSGHAATASLVTFLSGEPEKALYRRFRIRTTKTRDDFSMMKEVVKRRLGHLADWGKPDLLVVDGGKPQVSAAKSALVRLRETRGLLAHGGSEVFSLRRISAPPKPGRRIRGLLALGASINVPLPVIGFAKRFEEIVVHIPPRFHIVRLKEGDPALNLLRRLENEAHRFARAYHFKLRLKKVLEA